MRVSYLGGGVHVCWGSLEAAWSQFQKYHTKTLRSWCGTSLAHWSVTTQAPLSYLRWHWLSHGGPGPGAAASGARLMLNCWKAIKKHPHAVLTAFVKSTVEYLPYCKQIFVFCFWWRCSALCSTAQPKDKPWPWPQQGQVIDIAKDKVGYKDHQRSMRICTAHPHSCSNSMLVRSTLPVYRKCITDPVTILMS